MTIRALVAGEAGTPAVIDVVPAPVGPNDVRVRVRAAGICHSDLSMVNGTLAPQFPLILGHEAAGTVVAAGSSVDRVAVGDAVVLNWSPACRQCWYCLHGQPWLCERAPGASTPRGSTVDGVPTHVTLGVGALAEEVVIDAGAAIPVPAEVAPEQAALLGCAVLTGFGAVRNAARVRPGDSVLVLGLGGVGLSVLLAARHAGADPVIAVDISPEKEELARAAGATDFVVADETLSKAVRALTGGRGADHAFECVGKAATIGAAWRATRRGGEVTVLGMGRRDDMVQLAALDIFHWARTLRACRYGSADPDIEVPQLAEDVRRGELDLAPLITHRIRLDEAPEALHRMERGEGARSVVTFD
jgi:S-(hydroxymethyl)glutathione dehydrogenase/alcohol dehydrogenase